jgi:hypothetical protein
VKLNAFTACDCVRPASHSPASPPSHPWVTGQKRFVSNVAGSLTSLYSSSTDTAALDSIKGQALEFLSSSSTAPITDPAAATQAASALGALVTLPGALSPAQSASAATMLGNFASSSLSILLSGAASVDFAIEVSPVLVGGAMGVLGKLSAGSRRLLAYKDGMSAAYAALASSAKVQAFALAASQAASVTEQAPSLVSAVRRLASSSTLAQLVPAAALLDVPVAVAPDADASVPAGAVCVRVCARVLACLLALKQPLQHSSLRHRRRRHHPLFLPLPRRLHHAAVPSGNSLPVQCSNWSVVGRVVKKCGAGSV